MACVIEVPPIEPELSITKITSRGSGFLLGLLDRRRRDEGQQIVGIADMLAEQPDRRRLFGRRLPGQLEIAIRRHLAVGSRMTRLVASRAFDLDGMVLALDLAERKAGVEVHRDGWSD